jgi:prepilin-type N-terminal cleavage/methylation domain-containing protein
MFFRILKSKKGFSLVELMTVVVILGILSAVAVPMFINAFDAQARKDCKNQVTVIEAQVKEAMTGMMDNGAAQYKTELVGGIENKYLWIDFSKIQDDHKAKYAADDVEGNSDDVYNNKQCFVLIKSQDIPGKIAFTLGDLRGGYRPQNLNEYKEGCDQGYFLKKKKLENVEFYKYLPNEEIPICPFSNPDKNEIYYYYIFDDGEVICSCPKCHKN